MNPEIRSRSQIDRRALLRTSAAVGIALPFGVPALARAQDKPAEGTPDDGYIGSDPKSPSTGGETPNPSEPQEFQRRDPFLQPIEPGPKEFSLVAQDRSLYIAKDVAYAAWMFNGTVPGPFLHAVQGDEIAFTFSIDSETSTGHSVDLHSAQGDPGHNYKTIFPGEEFSWTFTPDHPGAYMYHCGTPPVLMHIGAGMYSTMIVRPKDGWPTEASQELVFVQSDFYFQDIDDAVKPMDYNKMLGNGIMDFTSFNGHATQYVDEPIKVKAGEPLRIYVVNAGPNVYCTFHVVGGIFDAGYFNANPENKVVGLQSMTVGPGDGIAVEITLEEPGLYPAVNHDFGHAAHGAIALLEAE